MTTNDTQKSIDHRDGRKEDRKIITPYAFTVSKELLGTPLGTPSRRAIAILLDLIFIALLLYCRPLALCCFPFLLHLHLFDKAYN